MDRPLRIETQVYVLVDGQRKQVEFTGSDGVARQLRVDIDLAQCQTCGALTYPGDTQHRRWHDRSGTR